MTTLHRLGELVVAGRLELNDGYRTKKSELGKPGIPILRVAEVQDGRLTPSYGDHVRIVFRQRIGSKTSRVGDVIVTTKGTVGRVARIVESDSEFVYSPQVCFFRTPTNSEIEPRWLYYWFRGPQFREQARGVQSQTDMADYINLADMRSMKITLPHSDEQRGIAATLEALDDKIESNRNLVRLIPKHVSARVGAALAEESETVPVAALARFVNGGAFTKGATRTGRMVIRIAELNSGPGGSTVYNDLDVPPEKLARPGDLLMSWSGSLALYRWARDEAIINQHIFKVLPDGLPAWLVHDRLSYVMPTFQAIAKDKATTMGHIQRGHLESTRVALPVRPTIERLDKELSSPWKRLLLAEREVLTLAALRDALLPELLSGRIRVPEAREAVEAAV